MRKSSLGGQNSLREGPAFYPRGSGAGGEPEKEKQPHITPKQAAQRGSAQWAHCSEPKTTGEGLVECTNLGARGPRGAKRSLRARGLRGLQFQDEILHVLGEKLQCKATQGYRSD